MTGTEILTAYAALEAMATAELPALRAYLAGLPTGEVTPEALVMVDAEIAYRAGGYSEADGDDTDEE